MDNLTNALSVEKGFDGRASCFHNVIVNETFGVWVAGRGVFSTLEGSKRGVYRVIHDMSHCRGDTDAHA